MHLLEYILLRPWLISLDYLDVVQRSDFDVVIAFFQRPSCWSVCRRAEQLHASFQRAVASCKHRQCRHVRHRDRFVVDLGSNQSSFTRHFTAALQQHVTTNGR